MAVNIYTISLGASQSYLIQDKGAIMIDVGAPKKINNFIKEAIAELKKVIWPNKKDLKNSTIIVITTIIIASIFIGLVDLFFTKVLTLFMG